MLNTILNEAKEIIKSEFNLEIEKSQLKLYSEKQWSEFCEINKFNKYSEGLYAPQSYSAYVNASSPALISNIFHEYFGHGLFCEHSQIGKDLTQIIENLGNEKEFLFNQVPNTQYFGFANQNIANYEGFALWLESFLCNKTDNNKIWKQKKETLPQNYNSIFETFKNIEEKMGQFAFMSQLGFPKYYDSEKTVELMQQFYGNNFSNIDHIILYGSQKPESDIDLFIISENASNNFFNGWLDIYELNREDFKFLLNNLDISVTDPLFSGELVYGDRNQLERIKQQILNQKITTEAINHNFRRSVEQENYLLTLSTTRDKNNCQGYIESYRKNSERLKKNKKCLTLDNLNKV